MERTWPAEWEDRMSGVDCPVCTEGRPDDNGYGIRFFQGRWCDAYLQRERLARGYSTVFWRGRHVAEPMDFDESEARGYWNDLMTVGDAIRRAFAPAKLNVMIFGNAIPHVHAHVVPRYVTDSAPGRPLPWPATSEELPEAELLADVRLLAQAVSQLEAGAEA